MDVLALLGIANHDANVFAVLDDRVALFEIGQRHFMPDGDVVFRSHVGCRVIIRDNAEHPCASLKVFDNDNANVVFWAVNEELRNFGQVYSPMTEFSL